MNTRGAMEDAPSSSMKSLSISTRGGKGGNKVIRQAVVNGVRIELERGNIVDCRVEALVNAANTLSFTRMDCGVSGALRNACLASPNANGSEKASSKIRKVRTEKVKGSELRRPTKVKYDPSKTIDPSSSEDNAVVGAVKTYWTDDGKEHQNRKLPETQAGVQAAAGILLARGVKFIIHAVGPIWMDYPVEEKTFELVTPRIKRTVRRALRCALKMGVKSVALPAISGGIFTHWKENSNIKEREQMAARSAVVEATFEFAASQPKSPEQDCGKIERILLVDLPKKRRGSIHLFARAFDSVVKEQASKCAINTDEGSETRRDEIDQKAS
mmetsp:Transcript_7183/g.9854  ORF Transcript_7183/g.9854 Transcript_7183/m.9854 type:complete len:328 (-) Transcript_7183:110-1093(-)